MSSPRSASAPCTLSADPTLEEVARYLGVGPRKLTGKWKYSCPFLHDEPLVTSLCDAADGTLRATISRQTVERVHAAIATAKSGRWVKPNGEVMLSTRRAVKELATVLKGMDRKRLTSWGKRCPHLEGRPLSPERMHLSVSGAPSNWYREADIQWIKASILDAARGYYGSSADPHMTPTAIQRELGPTRKTLREWEDKEWITPAWFHNRQRGASGGLLKRTYRKSAVLKVIRDGEHTFNGVFGNDGTPDTKVNAKYGANVAGVSTRTVDRLIESGKLPAQAQKPARGPGQHAISLQDLLALKKERHRKKNAGRPKGN